MLIISQNATNYDLNFPSDVVLRINLAWCNSLEELENNLKKHSNQEIFVDLPIGRIKPPNNKYSLKDLKPILNIYKNIKYFAISNVEDETDLDEFLDIVPETITIIPKIESPKGVKNIVAGDADVLLVPSVETGNALVKMLIYFCGACAAGVVIGSKVPVVITSRSDEAPARLASIAAAVVALD